MKIDTFENNIKSVETILNFVCWLGFAKINVSKNLRKFYFYWLFVLVHVRLDVKKFYG